ncbi:hypothetical protein Fmac_029362 [Flemingia macrophylla]|uniref:Secreted protein n=1 Tax=Flemingia macrophylla TaxID=520843 RepID=A0ABD1LAG0_9FABA
MLLSVLFDFSHASLHRSLSTLAWSRSPLRNFNSIEAASKQLRVFNLLSSSILARLLASSTCCFTWEISVCAI